MKFAASLKGINLDEGNDSSDAFDRVKARAQAKLEGMGIEVVEEGELTYAQLGIAVQTE